MSARLEKLKRRAARVEAGLSPAAIDGQREFEAEVARLRYRGVLRSQEPIVSRQPRRAALAWFALAILGALLAGFAIGSR